MKYLIGIDSGGTKSELAAYDLFSNRIYTIYGGYGNPAVNYDETIFNVCELIEKCLVKLGREDCLLIGIGMAAVETGNYSHFIREHIENMFHVETIVLNDAFMAFKAYFGLNDGIIVIAGTGSSCYVQKNGRGEMVGGWSHILGDEGSGYHTVIEAFKKIIYKFDRNLPYDNLSAALLEKVGGTSRSEIMNFIYNNRKNTIASLFKTIVSMSNIGDAAAIGLLERAGIFLAQNTYAAYEKKDFSCENKTDIGLKGGVFYNSSYVISSYKKEINKLIKNCAIKEDDISATKGVCNLFKYKLN